MGHRVTVFSTEGSSPDFEVEELAPAAWSADLGDPGIQRYRDAVYSTRVYKRLRQGDFDVIHEHTDAMGVALAYALELSAPVLVTAHGPLQEPQVTFFKEVQDRLNLVAISRSQADSAAELNWAGVVHNAVDVTSLAIGRNKRDRLFHLARVCPDKGQHRSIEVAQRMGLPLVLAGKLEKDAIGRAYFREKIEPHLGSGVTWIENVQGIEKAELLADSLAMLFPIQWEEPFGLAIAESMASGTPVVATRRGAVPELIEEGETGFVVDDDIDAMIAGVEKAARINPQTCAVRARDRFSPERMAEGYERVYLDAMGLTGLGDVVEVGESPIPAIALPALSVR
jgi:glycosyltransferase involved in cell wall biosynthesis